MFRKYAKGIFCVILAIILTSVNIAGNDVYAASRPAKPVFTVAKRNKKSAVLKINKTKNATGYQVFLSNSKNGKYQQVAASRTHKVKLLKLKKDKVYYVKVRAFRTVGYRITLGKFSKVQKIEKYGKKPEVPAPEETPIPDGTPNPEETPMPDGTPNPEETTIPTGLPDSTLPPQDTAIPIV